MSAIINLTEKDLDEIHKEFFGPWSKRWEIEHTKKTYKNKIIREYLKFVDYTASWHGYLEGYEEGLKMVENESKNS